MQRSFTYILLITCFFLFFGCKTQFYQAAVENRNLIVTDSFMPIDSQLVSIYLPYKLELEKDMKRVISFTSEEMVKEKPESNLTNFLADLLLEEGERLLKEEGHDFKPDISYFNYGGIRTFLPKGEITVGKIFELMPFENELVFLHLNGSQLQEFLNNIAKEGGDSLGGVRFKISGDNATDVELNDEPLRAEEFYWMITNDYVAAGGDGMDVLTERTGFILGNRKVRDVIIAHLEKKHEKNEMISVKPDGRIVYE